VLVTTGEVFQKYGPFDQVLYIHTTDAAVVERDFGQIQASRVTGMGGGRRWISPG